MNKPIIIDGCNVAECENIAIQDGYIGCTDNLVGECEGDNCIYKRLQRLKAENERLNKLTGIYSFRQMEKYKQALEDVREITKKYYLSDKKLLATGIEINPYGAIIEIQDKINEVLKDE